MGPPDDDGRDVRRLPEDDADAILRSPTGHLLPELVVRTLQKHFYAGVKHAEVRFKYHAADKDSVTGALANDLLEPAPIQIQVDGQAYLWSTTSFKIRGRGRNAPEKALGADGIFQFEVFDERLQRMLVRKGLLLQSKKRWTGTDEDLLGQARDLLAQSESSIVIDYSERGYKAFAARDVVAANGNRHKIRPRDSKSLAEKHPGAQIYHSAVATMPFADLARGVWEVMIDKGRLLAGLMLVENGHSETARIQSVMAEEFPDAERKVLSYARSLVPRLPFSFIDILLVDEMGTTFGCHGVDLNVLGRKEAIHGTASRESPQISALVFLDLHPAALGNAIGIGRADLVRSRLVRKMDSTATGLMALAITIPSLACVPMHFETDREILDAALSMNSLQPPEKARVVWIRNTSALAEFECSEPFVEEVTHWTDLSIASELHPLDFDADGNLRDFVIS